MNAQGPVLAIVGPTASGKTALSVAVAERIGGEVVSMDSRQVYRGMNIGTAKASPQQIERVPHHGLDLVNPDERFSAGRFSRFARACIQEIRERGHLPILVGGTGFFLRALTHPIFQEPTLEPEARHALNLVLASLPTDELNRWLAALDSESAERLRTAGGRQRLLRALELPLLTGRPLSWWHRHAPPEAPPLHPLVFVLDLPRAALYHAIDRRVDEMVEAGLVQEVAHLASSGYDEGAPGMNATGYREMLPYLRGDRSLEDALDLIRKHTRAYARRQLTWLRHQLPDGAIRLDASRPADQLVDEVVRTVRDGAWEQGTGSHTLPANG